MTARDPTYKFERKLSVDKQFELNDQPFELTDDVPPIPHFFTEKKISLHSHKHGFHNDERNGRGRFPIGFKNRREDPLSVLNEHERLEYSSTDQLSDISHTLAGLGARSGHSFQKEKIQFSLSSEVLDTEHQNMLLKKKMNEMKKELKYLRDHDQKMFSEIMQYKEKGEKAEAALLALGKEVQSSRQKVTEMQRELDGRQMRIQELQKLLAHNQRRKTDGKVSIMVQEVENYKQIVSKYESQMKQLKLQYSEEIAQLSSHYQSLLQDISKEFEMAKFIGQKQINELLTKLSHRDREIAYLRNRLAHYDFNSKMSTLVSDHHSPRQHNQKRTPSQYAQRFAKFSQFIDERIHRSCEKDRTQRQQRVIKSAVQQQQSDAVLSDLGKQIPGSPQNEGCLKITELLQKNERFKKQAKEFWQSG